MKNLFNKIKSFVQNLFTDVFNTFRANSAIVVKITDNIKTLVESPFMDVAISVIPGNIDDAILIKLRKTVPEIARKVAIAQKILSANHTNNSVIDGIIEDLKAMHPEARKSFWVIFSAELNVALSDGELTFSEAVILAQLAYTELKK